MQWKEYHGARQTAGLNTMRYIHCSRSTAIMPNAQRSWAQMKQMVRDKAINAPI
jgi:hypothetical protein